GCSGRASCRRVDRTEHVGGDRVGVAVAVELSCPDGWLALDSNGDPYPIAADVFRAIYAPA
ncbi:MAG TPA: hypothetical protein VK631_23815, partial [Solirubrobacteraceae bacterium]|nr:hypothetical protein [Solirubrobacteraceae bacterium]